MPIFERLKAKLAEQNPEAILYDGLEDALVGVAERPRLNPVAAYSYSKAVQVLMKRDGSSYEDACEFLDFNTTSLWVGENTPIFIYYAD